MITNTRVVDINKEKEDKKEVEEKVKVGYDDDEEKEEKLEKEEDLKECRPCASQEPTQLLLCVGE